MANKKIPRIKKNIRAFLNSEEGKITKKDALIFGSSLIMTGVMIGEIAKAADCWPAANHTSGCSTDCPANYASYCPTDFGSNCPAYGCPADCGSNFGTNNGSDNPTFYMPNYSADNPANYPTNDAICASDCPSNNSTQFAAVQAYDCPFDYGSFNSYDNGGDNSINNYSVCGSDFGCTADYYAY
jgi:hypothetical protein